MSAAAAVLARPHHSPAPPPHPIQKKSAQRVASKNGSNFGYFFPTSKGSTGGGEVFHTVSGQTGLDAVSVLATPPCTRPRGGVEKKSGQRGPRCCASNARIALNPAGARHGRGVPMGRYSRTLVV